MELQYLHSKINQEINQFPASSQTQRQRRWMKSRTRSKRVDRLIKWNLRASGNFGGRRHWKEDHVAPHRFVWVRPLKTWFTCMELIKVERKGQKKKKTPHLFLPNLYMKQSVGPDWSYSLALRLWLFLVNHMQLIIITVFIGQRGYSSWLIGKRLGVPIWRWQSIFYGLETQTIAKSYVDDWPLCAGPFSVIGDLFDELAGDKIQKRRLLHNFTSFSNL